MMTMILCALIVGWFVGLTLVSARSAPRKRPVSMDRFSYHVCGDEPLPTWRRKEAPQTRAVARRL